jgi:hypothetical protein
MLSSVAARKFQSFSLSIRQLEMFWFSAAAAEIFPGFFEKVS